VNQIAI